MRAVNKMSPSIKQQGVGLIEVLIAVLVLSIGFLGIAALQTKSLSNNNSSMLRTQATIAAYSMFDAMRADRAAALTGNYNGTITAGACPTASGTLAQTQLRNWCLGFDPTNPPQGNAAFTAATPPPATLLGGLAILGVGSAGAINCLGTGGTATASNCSVVITFNDSKASGGNAAQTLTFWTQL
ncbi:MAG: type IV pilus modification protein PilV [Halothiobacillaceae bacterium]|nr:type IV pilus modification protein PilV [Halothiobacillaceae bacterium]